jgi:integrase
VRHRPGSPAETRDSVRYSSAHSLRRQGEAATTKGWSDSEYLFVSITGAPLHEKNISNEFYALCDSIKVPRIRFHDCRHSCGSFLNAQGASAFTIQKILGHSQLSTTNRYTHIPLVVSKAALDGVDTLVEATRKKPEDKPDSKPAPTPQAATLIQ